MFGFTSDLRRTALFCAAALPLLAAGNTPSREIPKAKIPLYQGIQLAGDLSQPLRGLISDTYGYSGKLELNLRNTYFPTLEVGYAHFDETALNGIHNRSTGPYVKLGVNRTIASLGNRAENLFYAGLHLGFSSLRQSADNLVWNDTYWGNPINAFPGETRSAEWLDLTLGVRVRVLGPFSLGWSGHYRSTLHVSNSPSGNPAYLPGYGALEKPHLGLDAHLYYQLPF